MDAERRDHISDRRTRRLGLLTLFARSDCAWDIGRREITQAQFAQVEGCLPRQRGNVSLSNLQVLNAILYVAEHGCKWRGLRKQFGSWHTIYSRMSRWEKFGVLDRAINVSAQRLLDVRLPKTWHPASPPPSGRAQDRNRRGFILSSVEAKSVT